jgi:gamma-glutamyltranspeptidase/glutathione hydrolase
MISTSTNVAFSHDAPPRSPVLAGSALVASSHPSVSLAGIRVLSDGGNAVDAALAMAAMSFVALPGQCGIGGDAFALVREPDGRVWTVNGSGFGPDGGEPGFYTERDLHAIPFEGPLAVAVPGAPAALRALHAAGASRDLAELWAGAIRAAERGLPCTAKTRADILEHADALARDPDAASVLLPGGRAPQVGQALLQPQLADTLRMLAREPDSFYTGSFADRAVGALNAAGAPFSGDEWALGSQVTPEDALSIRYGDHVVHETPLPTPGWMVLQQAALCDGLLSRRPWLDAEAVHLMACSARVAFAHRVRECSTDTDAWRATLTAEAVAADRGLIASGKAPLGHAGPADGDTTSMVAVDSDGRAVSFIHSLAFTFGARIAVPGTGVLLNNRLGRGAYLMPGHPNEIRPRRRPLHTLNAWLVTDTDGRLEHVGNSPGGDGQVQWNMQLISHLLDHGLDPQTAVDAPRFAVFPGSDADVLGAAEQLRCESRLGAQVLDGLRRLGHSIRVDGPWAGGGSAMVATLDQVRGCLLGGADSRLDGVALGV